jgi:hypothetical protein
MGTNLRMEVAELHPSQVCADYLNLFDITDEIELHEEKGSPIYWEYCLDYGLWDFYDYTARRPETMTKGVVNDEELDPNQQPEIEMRVAKHRRGLVDAL